MYAVGEGKCGFVWHNVHASMIRWTSLSYCLCFIQSHIQTLKTFCWLRKRVVKVKMGMLGEREDDPEPMLEEPTRLESCKGCFKLFLKREKLIIAVFISVVLGFAIGMGINQTVQDMEEPDRTTLIVLLGFPGELLVRMLRMLVLPLIVCSLIVGLAGLEKHASGRVGRRAVVYYLSTTVIAAVLGLLIVVIIKPGAKASVPGYLKSQPKTRTLDSFLDLLR